MLQHRIMFISLKIQGMFGIFFSVFYIASHPWSSLNMLCSAERKVLFCSRLDKYIIWPAWRTSVIMKFFHTVELISSVTSWKEAFSISNTNKQIHIILTKIQTIREHICLYAYSPLVFEPSGVLLCFHLSNWVERSRPYKSHIWARLHCSRST